MHKNSADFSMQDIQKLAASPAGQQLLALLQQSDTAAINNAMAQAARGNLSQAKATLTPLLASEDVQKLLRQLGG